MLAAWSKRERRHSALGLLQLLTSTSDVGARANSARPIAKRERRRTWSLATGTRAPLSHSEPPQHRCSGSVRQTPVVGFRADERATRVRHRNYVFDLLADVVGDCEASAAGRRHATPRQRLSYAAAGGAFSRRALAWPPAHIRCASSPVAEKISSAFSPWRIPTAGAEVETTPSRY